MTPFWLQALQCLALYLMLMAIRGGYFWVAGKVSSPSAPKPTDGIDPKVCETCYQIGKTSGRGELIEQVEKLEADLADVSRQLANRDALVGRLREIEAKQDEIIAAMDEAIAGRDTEIAGLEKTIASMHEAHARLLTGYELERDRAADLTEQTVKLRRMNESIEKRLTDQIANLNNLIPVMKEATENRVRDGYSKGYALGQADAFERVRQVFPVDAS